MYIHIYLHALMHTTFEMSATCRKASFSAPMSTNAANGVTVRTVPLTRSPTRRRRSDKGVRCVPLPFPRCLRAPPPPPPRPPVRVTHTERYHQTHTHTHRDTIRHTQICHQSHTHRYIISTDVYKIAPRNTQYMLRHHHTRDVHATRAPSSRIQKKRDRHSR